ncbi:MAG TPA: translation elongation factor Ts [Victivallales bacterium]|nr:translation elongation factor Ts [Victivallales bacterium]
MAQISAQLVKELREKTGAGMMDCKKALSEANGDISAAIDVLRKSGIAKAEKKSGRSAKEGLISSTISDNCGALVEVLCETDFVSKNDKFQAYVAETTKKVSECTGTDNVSEEINASEKDNLISMIATIGENIQIRRAARWTGKCASYLHMGGRIGVMVEYEGDATKEALNDICMHIAAFNPQYVKPEEISEATIAKEKEIHSAQLEGKPAEMIEKILIGKLAKWYKEVCLNKQPWVRDDKLSTEKANPNITVKRFVRWQVGEDL